MRTFIRRPKRKQPQAGMSMIELLIAEMVFVICMIGVVPIFVLAIGNNSRGKVDTTSTELAQSVIEQITAVLARGGPASITDCGEPPKTWTIETASNTGIALNGTGSIDFSAAPVDKYSMDFVMCGETPTANAVYDVRWRIEDVAGSTTRLVIVSARPKIMNQRRFAFNLPVTLRTYVGPQ